MFSVCITKLGICASLRFSSALSDFETDSTSGSPIIAGHQAVNPADTEIETMVVILAKRKDPTCEAQNRKMNERWEAENINDTKSTQTRSAVRSTGLKRLGQLKGFTNNSPFINLQSLRPATHQPGLLVGPGHLPHMHSGILSYPLQSRRRYGRKTFLLSTTYALPMLCISSSLRWLPMAALHCLLLGRRCDRSHFFLNGVSFQAPIARIKVAQ